jgi:L-ascorbate metabolism protein UlaG (beta-lactamase superfamily)
MTKHIINPALPIIKPDWEGNVMIGSHFCNLNKKEHYNIIDILKWKLLPNPQRAEKKADKFRVDTIPNTVFTKPGQDKIVWLGHNCFFIRLGGVSFLTDPNFYKMKLKRRLASMPCNSTDLTNIDYLLLSHNHRDHLDKKSVKELAKVNPSMKALLPLRLGNFAGKYVRNFQDAGWYQQYEVTGDVKVFLLPAMHWSRRGLFDNTKTLWGSYIIKSADTTIFFAGDTRTGTHFADIASLFPKIDYALMPIGAFKPGYIMSKAHMSPNESVEAGNILNPNVFIPMHYGTYDLSNEPIGEPYRDIIELKNQGKLNAELRLLNIGEELKLT